MLTALWIITVLGLVVTVVHLAMIRRWSELTLLGVVTVLGALFVAVGMGYSALFEAWMREDGWVEWATFFAFLLAGLLGIWRARRVDIWLVRLGILAVAIFCLFVAAEEISWGQRLLSFKPPEIFLKHNYQQELNLHNLLTGKRLGGFKLDSKYFVILIALAYGVGGAALGAVLRRRDRGHEISSLMPFGALAFGFLSVAWAELAYPIDLTGEAAELMLGMLFLADAVHKREHSAHGFFDSGLWCNVLILGAPLLVGLGVALGTDWLLHGSADERQMLARHELELLAQDMRVPGSLGKRLGRKKYVHKRLFTAQEAGYLKNLEGLGFLGEKGISPRVQGRRTYFLDPWNNPYWLYYRRKSSALVLYSFGGNRRRDSVLEKKGIVRPDDISVTISIER
ncbi:MAG: hypothetical protein R3C68_05265 [Myxococcota bacterium]